MDINTYKSAVLTHCFPVTRRGEVWGTTALCKATLSLIFSGNLAS